MNTLLKHFLREDIGEQMNRLGFVYEEDGKWQQAEKSLVKKVLIIKRK